MRRTLSGVVAAVFLLSGCYEAEYHRRPRSGAEVVFEVIGAIATLATAGEHVEERVVDVRRTPMPPGQGFRLRWREPTLELQDAQRFSVVLSAERIQTCRLVVDRIVSRVRVVNATPGHPERQEEIDRRVDSSTEEGPCNGAPAAGAEVVIRSAEGVLLRGTLDGQGRLRADVARRELERLGLTYRMELAGQSEPAPFFSDLYLQNQREQLRGTHGKLDRTGPWPEARRDAAVTDFETTVARCQADREQLLRVVADRLPVEPAEEPQIVVLQPAGRVVSLETRAGADVFVVGFEIEDVRLLEQPGAPDAAPPRTADLRGLVLRGKRVSPSGTSLRVRARGRGCAVVAVARG